MISSFPSSNLIVVRHLTSFIPIQFFLKPLPYSKVLYLSVHLRSRLASESSCCLPSIRCDRGFSVVVSSPLRVCQGSDHTRCTYSSPTQRPSRHSRTVSSCVGRLSFQMMAIGRFRSYVIFSLTGTGQYWGIYIKLRPDGHFKYPRFIFSPSLLPFFCLLFFFLLFSSFDFFYVHCGTHTSLNGEENNKTC